ncbi:F-box only protein 44-like [Podarcis raffonei]|uniref:F-box only protein 44-like n=1 Tax=Podarcis raffonei TaxID=65483 RepID=UPI0023297881|nr:F-box only protein 44-like [Podarcis raffonei]
MASLCVLPDHLLLDILSLVPMGDLIRNCRPVCSRWRDLVDLPVLWKRLFRRKDNNQRVPVVPRDIKAYYILGRLEKNLIKNPFGEDGLDYWTTKTVGEAQWKIQEVSEKASLRLGMRDFPLRNRPVDDGPCLQVKKCFAACDGLCAKSQFIILKDEGYWDELIDRVKPTVVVSDCFYYTKGTQYQLLVQLLSADFKVLRERCSEDLFMNGSKHGRWREVCYSIFGCPPGVRYIYFEHRGQNVNERNHKGVRITNTSITLKFTYTVGQRN